MTTRKRGERSLKTIQNVIYKTGQNRAKKEGVSLRHTLVTGVTKLSLHHHRCDQLIGSHPSVNHGRDEVLARTLPSILRNLLVFILLKLFLITLKSFLHCFIHSKPPLHLNTIQNIIHFIYAYLFTYMYIYT